MSFLTEIFTRLVSVFLLEFLLDTYWINIYLSFLTVYWIHICPFDGNVYLIKFAYWINFCFFSFEWNHV